MGLEETKDLRFYEESLEEKNMENFLKLLNYWREEGAELAYKDAYWTLHKLEDMPHKNAKADRSELIATLCKEEIDFFDPNLKDKIENTIEQAIEDGDSRKIKRFIRILYLLGVYKSSLDIVEQIKEVSNDIDDKYKASLCKVVDLQREFGWIGNKEDEKDEK